MSQRNSELPYASSRPLLKIMNTRGLLLVQTPDLPSTSQPQTYLSDGVASFDDLLLPPMVPGGFKNLTQVKTPRAVQILLSWGPKFVPPHNGVVLEYTDTMQFLFDAMLKNHNTVHPESCFRELMHLHFSAFNTFYKQLENKNDTERMLYYMLSVTEAFLKKHPDLSILQADIGKVTILIETAAYRQKINNWILKCTTVRTYRLIGANTSLKTLQPCYNLYKNIAGLLRAEYLEVLENGGGHIFPPELFNMLEEYKTEGRHLPYLYGVVKCLEEDNPCYHIWGSLHWYTYPLQKIVSYTLTKALKDSLSPQNVGDMNKAAHELHAIPLCDGYEFVKFNIVDMYNNMDTARITSLVETLTKRRWYKDAKHLSSDLILQCLRYTIDQASYFSYDGRVYQQICGLPQDGCDSAILATFLLDYLIQFHYETLFPEHHIVYWWKYMDDFLVYIPTDRIESFKTTFEHITDLSLTMAREEDTFNGPSINFLDLLIVRGPLGIEISLHTEPTSSLRMIHYFSHHLRSYKEKTIKGFIKNVLTRTSNCKLETDLVYYEQKFYHNSYPALFVGNQFRDVISEELQKISDHCPSLPMSSEKLQERRLMLLRFMGRFNQDVDVAPI